MQRPAFLSRCIRGLAILCGFWSLSGCIAFAREIVFAGYNIENYAPLVEAGKTKPLKTAEAADAVIRIIKEINPDILGVSEMGSPLQFEQFRKRLADAGLGYTDFEYVEAVDADRHLALLSRLPIVARQSLTDLSYEAGGSRQKVRRGILDVTVAAGPRYRLRILGAHLKSKLPSRDGDESLRRNEAHLLRAHADKIVEADARVNLLVYGDFNDTRDQATVREVAGLRGTAEALTPLPLEDSLGDRWTHYWKVDDVYSRIDYLFVNRALAQAVIGERCYLYRSPLWKTASDHRPLVATFRAVDP